MKTDPRYGKLLSLSMAIALSGCTSVPKGPALTLANAGIAATGAFGTEVRDTASQILYVDASDAFVATYDVCEKPAICKPLVQSDVTFQDRQKLVDAILLRGRALDALGKAYGALKTEAEYDARGDLIGATNAAIDGVNTYAAAIAAIGGAAPAVSLIKEPLKGITGFAVGLLADRNQRRRLVAGSEEIAKAATRLRDALKVEAFVYDSLAEYIQKNRTAARIRLVRAGIVSSSDALTPLTGNLGIKPAPNADAAIAQSPRAKTAIEAVLQAQSRADVAAARNKYAASISALDSLLQAHDQLKTGQSVSLVDVDRFLGELDTAIGGTKKE